MQQADRHVIVDTIRHALTGKQILDQCLKVFQRNRDAVIWLVVPDYDVDSTKKKIRVALAKERHRMATKATEGEIGEEVAATARLFTLAMSNDTVKIGKHRVGLQIRYTVTKTQQRQRVYSMSTKPKNLIFLR